jgi:hypothetical protein
MRPGIPAPARLRRSTVLLQQPGDGLSRRPTGQRGQDGGRKTIPGKERALFIGGRFLAPAAGALHQGAGLRPHFQEPAVGLAERLQEVGAKQENVDDLAGVSKTEAIVTGRFPVQPRLAPAAAGEVEASGDRRPGQRGGDRELLSTTAALERE